MSYSVNFYLDNAISKKNLEAVHNSGDNEAKRKILKEFDSQSLQIFVYLRYAGKTIKAYTERRCTQKQWDSKKQRVNPRFYKSGSIQLNNYLEGLSNIICKTYEENLKKKIPTTKEQIKIIIYHANEKDAIGTNLPTFEEAYKEFINVSRMNKQNSTLTIYRTTLKHLQNFSKNRSIPLLYDRIDIKFEDSLREYLITEQEMTNNTIAKYLKTLKTFLNYCTERGYNHRLDYKKFDSNEREREVYALSLEELMNIFKHDFNSKRLDRVRDVFCFACFTGLRFSDVSGLRRENIIRGESLHFTVRKTKEITILPLNPFAQKILAKYKDEKLPLPVISSQKTNSYLKEIGRILEIIEPVRILMYRGQERIEYYVPKHEILTFHIARKTFITNSLILGMHEREVKEFSGHKKEENFRKYVKYADNYKKKVMNHVWSEGHILKAQQK